MKFSKPRVMGILNVTPDSFSDGGKYFSVTSACKHALAMIADGADIIDIGGESTRPAALPITLDEELQRVIPVIQAIRKQTDIPISIDTSHPHVMSAAIAAGATMINDIRALTMPGAMEVLQQNPKIPICIMHMKGTPANMQNNPSYEDIVSEVKQFFKERIEACEKNGIERQRLIIDPGFGFGKTAEHNLQLLKALPELQEFNLPILVGLSRKAMLEKLLGLPIAERLPASLALAVIAAQKGANIIRVHDVKETVEALAIVNFVEQ